MLIRDPTQLFERYGRQLLVQDARFDGQQDLHRLGASFAADTSACAQAAAEAAARYLVGAGLGRALVPSAWAVGLMALDPQLQLVAAPAELVSPAAHLHFALRPWGAEVEVERTSRGGLVASCTLRWRCGGPASPEDAVALGAAVAQLLVEEALGFAILPCGVELDLRDPVAPRRTQAARPAVPTWLESLPVGLADQLGTWSEQRYPREACGVLVLQENAQVLAVVADNLQDSLHAADPEAYPRTAHTAFLMDTRVIAQQEAQGRRLVALWHSHCDAPGVFSAEDLRQAAPDGQPLYPHVVHAVVEVRDGRALAVAYFAWSAEDCIYQRIG